MIDVLEFGRRTMMAKMTLGKISNESFTAAMQELLKKPLPVKTAFRLKTLTNKFNEELAKYSELRKGILDRYCKRNEDGSVNPDQYGNYQFDHDKLADVTKELADLAAIEVEFTPVSIDDLGNIDLAAQTLFDIGEVLS